MKNPNAFEELVKGALEYLYDNSRSLSGYSVEDAVEIAVRDTLNFIGNKIDFDPNAVLRAFEFKRQSVAERDAVTLGYEYFTSYGERIYIPPLLFNHREEEKE